MELRVTTFSPHPYEDLSHLDFSMPQFPHPRNEGDTNSNIYFIELLYKVNKVMPIKCLARREVHTKHLKYQLPLLLLYTVDKPMHPCYFNN